MGITAGSREVPGRNACDRRHTYRIIIIIIIIIIRKALLRTRLDTLSRHCLQHGTNSRHQQFVTWRLMSACPQCVVELAAWHPSDVWNFEVVEHVRNIMAHAQKPDLVFLAKGTSPFKSAGESVQSTIGSRGVRISG